jgi:hypothetical protein
MASFAAAPLSQFNGFGGCALFQEAPRLLLKPPLLLPELLLYE